MDFVLDLLQGIGIAAAVGIRPFLPVLAGRRARRGEPRHGLRRHRLRVPGGAGRSCSARSCWSRGLVYVAPPRGPRRAGRARLRAGRPRASCSARSRRPARWPTTTTRSSPGVVARRRRAALGFFAARSLFIRVRRRLDAEAAGALPVYGEGAALAGAGALDPLPAARAPRDRRARLAAARRPPPRGREVRRPAHPAVKKLVLVVIDAMKPAMLERAVASGRAPTLELLIERGQHVDDCVAAFPSVTPGVRRLDRHRHRARTSTRSRR